jgi:hypothetical protein
MWAILKLQTQKKQGSLIRALQIDDSLDVYEQRLEEIQEIVHFSNGLLFYQAIEDMSWRSSILICLNNTVNP